MLARREESHVDVEAIPGSVIIVGVDETAESKAAVRYAAAVAVGRHALLRTVHAYPAPAAHGRANDASHRQASADAWLTETLAEIALPTDLSTERVARPGPAVAVLQDASAQADRIVLGQHHLRIGDRAIGGGVASSLAAKALCPIEIVPRKWFDEGDDNDPIVVAVDLESDAGSALPIAFDIIVLHATSADEVGKSGGRPWARLDQLLATWRTAYPKVSVHPIVLTGDPGDTLIGASRDASLLIIGRPAEQRRWSWTLSVARALLQRSQCPLIVVPDKAGPKIADTTRPVTELTTQTR